MTPEHKAARKRQHMTAGILLGMCLALTLVAVGLSIKQVGPWTLIMPAVAALGLGIFMSFDDDPPQPSA